MACIIPFWTYDTNTTTDYTGQRGEYYYETETYYETDCAGKSGAAYATGETHSLVSRFGNSYLLRSMTF